MKPTVKDREEYCGNCNAKVGYYYTKEGTYIEMCGGETQNWGYTKLDFCGNCGEKVERG